MYVLDTNVISELRKPSCDPRVRAWVAARRPMDLYLSAITIYELDRSVRLVERRDEIQGKILRRWLTEDVRELFSGRILPFDERAALAAASYHVPDPVSERDSMIAAIADVNGMVLVTRNVKDVVATGVTVLNPWDA